MTNKQFWHSHYPEGIPTSLDLPGVSLYHFLQRSAEKYPVNPAIVFLNQEITYVELKERVDRIATALYDLGIKKGNRIAILLPNCPQLVISYYALLRIGAVGVMVNPMYTERELLYLLKDSGAETIILLEQLKPKVMKVLPQTAITTVISTEIQEYLDLGNDLNQLSKTCLSTEKEAYSFEQLLVKYLPALPEINLNVEKDIALLQYTGGTTGIVKGAMLTHGNLSSNVVQTRYWLDSCREGMERFFCVLPFFHVFAMTTCMNLSVYLASTMILIPRLEAMNLLKQIEFYRPTVFQGVPSLYVAVIANPDVRKYDLSSVRVCLSGGAPLPAEVQQKFEAVTGAKLVEGYGLTEASPVTHCNPVNEKIDGSIGLPIPNTEFKIVDLETGTRELLPGEIGELCIRGPQVMKGYWNMPEETEKVLREGWLYTGDIAWMDEKGFTYIVDRKKDMVISMGYNIYPREVEEVLYEHPKVKEAAVIGIRDRSRGEVLKAFVVIKEGEQAKKDEIIKFCRQQLTQYKVPKKVEFRTELPKSMVGKILRRVLIEEETNREK
ncbi:AMP-dependent synthetase and ligase [Desulforamulus reducens MI-1]|uniref:AMP-dependent synthetase and ligase n=1 Tax=Desulforamulus reducens (strain ATCC BAA-1160 / DSM 100696 / MI-1) TaxID=349161 RepID=A4J8R3_DESRM|nr:long-chain fatty acid--CoA ligase [Desulforamulus reducens]ABO51466.1 AMP-dependent synthetase and ligase [Desulforamulus reducens MI-1]